MTTTALEKQESNGLVSGINIDYAAVLRTLHLDPRKAEVQALVLTCKRYELDPVLSHMVLIQSKPYVTHRGLWHIAHRSGELDGEEIIEEGERDGEWFARVAIYRKGWDHPVTMTGRYPKSGQNKHYGPEMAVTRAECLVLRRLFDVALPVQEERDWDAERTSAPSAVKPPPPFMDSDTGEVKPPTRRRPPPRRPSEDDDEDGVGRPDFGAGRPFEGDETPNHVRIIKAKALTGGIDSTTLGDFVTAATDGRTADVNELRPEEAGAVLSEIAAAKAAGS